MPKPLLAFSQPRRATLRRRLIGWFQANQRVLPWRADPSPYRVWLSEVMLQQTQVVTVQPYFDRFIRRFPTVESLAAADLQEVLGLWAGLGYYHRARNLHRAAGMIVTELAGRFPQTVEELLRLPGVGRYSAGAIRSIAFNQPAPIVDGNVARVLSRLFALPGDPRATANQRRLWQLAEQLVDSRRPSQFNQGLMELGALVCTPSTPSCLHCPLARICAAKATGRPESFPSAGRRGRVLAERWAVAVITASDGRMLLVQRPAEGRWAGLWEFPGLVIEQALPADSVLALRRFLRQRVGLAGLRLKRVGQVRHQLSHRDLAVEVLAGGLPAKKQLSVRCGPAVRWAAGDLSDLPVSRLTRKIVAVASATWE